MNRRAAIVPFEPPEAVEDGSPEYLQKGGELEYDAEWWEAFSKCVMELEMRGRFAVEYDEAVLQKYLLYLNRSKLSRGQLLALCGLKTRLQYKGASTVETWQTRSSSSTNDILSKGLERAIAAYDASTSRQDAGPFLIQEYIPFCTFEKWYKEQENVWRIAFQFTDAEGGAVLLYGDPSFLHEGITGWFVATFMEQATLLYQAPISPMIDLLGSARIILPTGLHKEPDHCMQATGSNHKVPSFVIEVAYANETLQVLQEELVQWTLQGGAEIAYGVKVSLCKSDYGEQIVSLRFLERRQGVEGFSKNIDFSPLKCTQSNDPAYEVEFPLVVLFGIVTNDRRLVDGVVRFDLFQLQVKVLKLLENTAVDFVWHPKRPATTDRSPVLKGVKEVVKKKGALFKLTAPFRRQK